MRTSSALYIFLTLLLVLLFTTAVTAAAGDDSQPEAVDTSVAASTLGIAHGAHLRPVFIDNGSAPWYSYGQELSAFNGFIGKDTAVLMWFLPWSRFDPFFLNEIQKHVPESRRPVVMLTWEPSIHSNGCSLGYSDGQGPLRAINSGRCDGYIRDYARALKARPERIILRFAHEMNITNSSWWPGHYNLRADAYVAMYRRVHDIFRAEGVRNVEWMWSPNNASNPPDPWNDLHNYYPGDAYVDWIGLSGFNWYSERGRPWEEFRVLFDGILKDLGCRYAKPVIISEIGTVDGPSAGSKASWISQAYNQMADYPFVRGIVWFNDFAYGDRGHADFRVTTGTADCHQYGDCSGVRALPGASGQQSTSAYIASVRQSIYTSKLPSLSQATPPSTLCAQQGQPFALNSNIIALRPGRTREVILQGLLYSSPVQVSLQMPSGISATASPSALPPPWGKSVIKLTADARFAKGSHMGAVRAGSTSLPLTIINPPARVFIPSVGK